MVTLTRPTTATLEDARPILPRSDRTLWAIADERRDALYSALEAVSIAQGVNAAVSKSVPYHAKPWVSFEAWHRRGESTTQRGFFSIEIIPKPGHTFTLEYVLRFDVGGKKFSRGPLSDLPAVESMVAFALGRQTKPRVGSLKLRTTWWHLWRPKNSLSLKPPPLSIAARYFAVIGLLMALSGAFFSPVGVIGGLLVIASIALWFLASRGTELVCDAGRPQSEPRFLRILDSWQVVVSGLGATEKLLQKRFRGSLAAFTLPDLSHAPETIGYWTPDGRVERPQYVLKLRRSIVFVHIYAYGEDLYIGWDGHLNSGSWMEKTIGYGVDEGSGQKARYTTVEPAQASLSEYDLSDANVLMEWTHAQLVRYTKELMAERKIDQEVDFTIVRGNRQGITSDPRAPEKPGRRLASALGMLRSRL